MKFPTLQIPILAPAYCGSAVPDDWQNWHIQKFRDIREIKGITAFERVVGIPVIGDSLNNIGIHHGDILITRITLEYKADRIGIWQTPYGQTAKYAMENFDGSVTLHNKNGWFQTWQPEDLKLIGIVVRVERDYE